MNGNSWFAGKRPIARNRFHLFNLLGFVLNRIVTWQLILRIGLASFAGLMLLALFQDSAISKSSFFTVASCTLAAIWGVTVIIFIPLRVFLDRPIVREMQACVRNGEIDPERLGWFRRQLFYSSFGSLPKWIYMPFVAIALCLAAAFVLAPFVIVLLFLFTDVFKA